VRPGDRTLADPDGRLWTQDPRSSKPRGVVRRRPFKFMSVRRRPLPRAMTANDSQVTPGRHSHGHNLGWLTCPTHQSPPRGFLNRSVVRRTRLLFTRINKLARATIAFLSPVGASGRDRLRHDHAPSVLDQLAHLLRLECVETCEDPLLAHVGRLWLHELVGRAADQPVPLDLRKGEAHYGLVT